MGNGSYLATVWEQEEEVAQCAMEEEIYALGISEKVEREVRCHGREGL